MTPQSGFSLVEVLCALLILGVGLVGITEAITASLRSTKEAEQYTTAAMLASSQLEILRAEGWLVEGEEEGDFGSAFAAYSWTRTVERTDRDGLFDVTVQIERQPEKEILFELRTRLFDMPYESPADWEEERRNSTDRRRTNRRSSRRGRRL